MAYRARAIASLAGTGMLLAGCVHAPATPSGVTHAAHQAQDEVNGATVIVTRMQTKLRVAALLRVAKGVLVVPQYGKGAYFLGGQGGNGVLLLRDRGGQWSQPAFYMLGEAGSGPRADGESGPLAMVLMTDNAVARFLNNTSTWRLGANMGLSASDFSGLQTGPRASPKADIVIWRETKGLPDRISASAIYITPDASLDYAYYRGMVTNQEILSNVIANSRTASLREALAGGSGASYR